MTFLRHYRRLYQVTDLLTNSILPRDMMQKQAERQYVTDEVLEEKKQLKKVTVPVSLLEVDLAAERFLQCHFPRSSVRALDCLR